VTLLYRFSVLVSIACTLILMTGCKSIERPCREFYHPEVDRWSPLLVGSSMRFISSEGEVVSYTLVTRTDSEPYSADGHSSQDPSRLTCIMESEHVYTLDGNSNGATIRLLFQQFDLGTAQPVEQQNLVMNVGVEEPAGSDLSLGYALDVNDPEANGRYPPHGPNQSLVSRYFPEREMGKNFYQTVIEEENLDRKYVEQRAPSMASAITRVAFAEGVGLVEFERVDGTVFSRVPE